MKNNIRLLIAAILIIGSSIAAKAQKIQVVDPDGNPVSYASIMDVDDGKYIGQTDLDGRINNLYGAKNISISHVAFKYKSLAVASLPADGRVTLDYANFALPEVTITKTDYVYVQTYYRMIYLWDDTVEYYRVGLTDNVYDIRKGKVSSDHEHYSKASMGVLKFALNTLIGSILDNHSNLPTGGLALNLKKTNYSLVEETPERRRVLYRGQPVGIMIDDRDNMERRLSYDRGMILKLEDETKSKKPSKHDERTKNEVETTSIVYQLDGSGQCDVADYVKSQFHSEHDSYMKSEKKDVHVTIWLEVYSTDRAYVDKKGAKEYKRKNRIDMNYKSLQQFERQHNIPALPPVMQKALDTLIKSKEK